MCFIKNIGFSSENSNIIKGISSNTGDNTYIRSVFKKYSLQSYQYRFSNVLPYYNDEEIKTILYNELQIEDVIPKMHTIVEDGYIKIRVMTTIYPNIDTFLKATITSDISKLKFDFHEINQINRCFYSSLIPVKKREIITIIAKRCKYAVDFSKNKF